MAKNDLGSVFGLVLAKNCSFRFTFGFTKLTAVLVFLFGSCTVCRLMCKHYAACIPVYSIITVLFISVSHGCYCQQRS